MHELSIGTRQVSNFYYELYNVWWCFLKTEMNKNTFFFYLFMLYVMVVFDMAFKNHTFLSQWSNIFFTILSERSVWYGAFRHHHSGIRRYRDCATVPPQEIPWLHFEEGEEAHATNSSSSNRPCYRAHVLSGTNLKEGARNSTLCKTIAVYACTDPAEGLLCKRTFDCCVKIFN